VAFSRPAPPWPSLLPTPAARLVATQWTCFLPFRCCS
jgi:hypothetical protein